MKTRLMIALVLLVFAFQSDAALRHLIPLDCPSAGHATCDGRDNDGNGKIDDGNIAVNAVAPGLILSDTLLENPDIMAFQVSAIMQARSLRRDAYPEDVEGTVVFLASDDSSFMSGQTLVVDGGSVFSTL